MKASYKRVNSLVRSLGLTVVFVFGVLSTLGSGGSGDFYMSPCFPFPESWCTPTPGVPDDTTPPTAPAQLVSEAVSASSIELDWSESTDNNYVIGYKIYRDGVYINYVAGSVTAYTDSGLESLKEYCYRVSAYDNYGNESTKSNLSCATTLQDTQPPTIPTDLSVTYIQTSPTEKGIELNWSPSTDDVGVTGYKIYKDDVYLADVDLTTYTDFNIEDHTKYCYAITAFDKAGNESDKSAIECALSSWFLNKLDISVWNQSIDTTSNNILTISYINSRYDVTADKYYGDLKYADNTNNTFNITIVDSIEGSSYGTYHSSLKLDSSDHAHIAYCSYPSGSLKYATNVSGNWETELLINTSNLSQCEISIDSNNNAHIVYNASGEIHYTTNQTGSWQTTLIEDINLISSCSIAITVAPSDDIHISHHDYTQFTIDGELVYTTNASGSWEKTIVDSDGDVGRCSSITTDSYGNIHISYSDNINDKIKYATNSSGAWVTEFINNDTNAIGDSSIDIDKSDKIHISYIQDPSETLLYSNNTTGNWKTYEIDHSSWFSSDTSLAVDSNNDLHIIYNTLYKSLYATTQSQ